MKYQRWKRRARVLWLVYAQAVERPVSIRAFGATPEESGPPIEAAARYAAGAAYREPSRFALGWRRLRPLGGAVVFVPAGTWAISSPVRIPAAVKLRGE